MVKIKLIGLLMIISMFFCGCFFKGEIDEIEQLAFVSNIGIDKGPNEEGILVSVRITDYESISGSSNLGASEVGKGFHVISAKGETFYKAIRNLQANSQQKIFFGQNKTIIFGKEFAESGIAEVIDGMERNIEISGSNKIFISETSAVETLNMTIDSKAGSKTDFVNAMQEAIMDDSIIAPIMLYQFTLELKSDSKISYAPVIGFTTSGGIEEEQQNNDDNQEVINMEKTAIIKDNKLIGILPRKETTSLLWIRDKFEDDTLIIPVKTDKGEDFLTIEIRKGKTKIKTELTEEGLIVKINCKGDAYLREVSYGAEILQDEHYMTKIGQLINDQLKMDLEASIQYAKNQMKCDYFGIAHAVHNQLPDYWKEIGDQWEQIFQVATFIVTCNIELKDIGMINEPASTIIEEGDAK